MTMPFPGSYAGKNRARTITHDALELLAPEAYHHSPHLYLAGPGAGDIVEARRRKVSPTLLYAAETNYDTYLSAVSNAPTHCRRCIYPADVVAVARQSSHKFGIIFLDTCGTIQESINLLQQTLPYLAVGGMAAINATYTSDYGWATTRRWRRHQLSANLRDQPNWRATATAVEVGNQLSGCNRLFFPVALSYRNNGGERARARAMLTLIGKRSAKRNTEPLFHMDVSNGHINYSVESGHPSANAFKAHLPQPFKSWWYGMLT